MKRKRPTVSIDSEIGRRVGPVGKTGRGTTWKPIGVVAATLLGEVLKKRQ